MSLKSPLAARSARLVALVALAALPVSACGRFGPLEPPGGVASAQAPAGQSPAGQSPDQALNPQAKPKIPPILPPNQPFLLDPLLK